MVIVGKKGKNLHMDCFYFRAHFIFYGVVLDYNFVQDSNLFSKTNVLLKGTTTSTLRKVCRSKHNKRVFEKENVYLEDESNEGLSRIPNGLKCFCMDLIKTLLLCFDLQNF